jgi:hypothetical protein
MDARTGSLTYMYRNTLPRLEWNTLRLIFAVVLRNRSVGETTSYCKREPPWAGFEPGT